jgi:hypothetical protein
VANDIAPADTCIIFRQNDGRSPSGTARGEQAFALCTLAGKLANAADSFGLFARTLLGRLFVVVAHLHFAENAFALHLLLESAESLINIVVANQYLHVNPVPYLELRFPNRVGSRTKTTAPGARPSDWVTQIADTLGRSPVPDAWVGLEKSGPFRCARPLAGPCIKASQKKRCAVRFFAISCARSSGRHDREFSRMRKYSAFAVAREALRGHSGWEKQWTSPEPKSEYDIVIIGAGGHGLGTAYYLAKEHGITNIAVIEKGWLGGGNTGRNTTIIRSNYLYDESAALYNHALKLWDNLSQD